MNNRAHAFLWIALGSIFGLLPQISEAKLPTKIECPGANRIYRGFPEMLRFYTRLSRISAADSLPQAGQEVSLWRGGKASAPSDETAAQLESYVNIFASRTTLHYSVTSCDTEDFYFTFPMQELIAGENVREKEITASVLTEIRGEVELPLTTLACKAHY